VGTDTEATTEVGEVVFNDHFLLNLNFSRISWWVRRVGFFEILSLKLTFKTLDINLTLDSFKLWVRTTVLRRVG
jgi:hypothetical protein